MGELAKAMQRAQLLTTPAWDALLNLAKMLGPYYREDDDSFLDRIRTQRAGKQ